MDRPVIFYTYPSCTSCRKTKEWLKKNNVPYIERHLFKNPPTPKELKNMFEMTTMGTDELLSKRSHTFKSLDLNLEDLTLSQLYELLTEEPRLLRRPIITNGEQLIVGYNKEALETLLA